MFPSTGSGNGILFYRCVFWGNVPFDRLRERNSFLKECFFWGNVPFDRLRERNSFLQECFFWGMFPSTGRLMLRCGCRERNSFLQVCFWGGMFPSTSSGNGFVSCQGMLSHGGRVSGVRRFVCADCRIECGNDNVCGRSFFATYARLEGRGTRCRRQWSGSGTLESG